MMIKSTLFVVYTFLAINLSGQANFTEGTVINLKGDTLRGEIDYRGWNDSPRKIKFRDTIQSIEKEFLPGRISQFQVSGERYISAFVDIQSYEFDASSTYNLSKVETTKDTVFLKILVDGEPSLYEFRDGDKTRCYYFSANDSIHLFRNVKYQGRKKNLSSDNSLLLGTTYVTTNLQVHTWVGQLRALLGPGNYDEDLLRNPDYSREKLMAIYASYFRINAISPRYTYLVPEASHKFGIMAGAALNFIHFNSSDKYSKVDFIGEINYPVGIGYLTGFFFETTSPGSLKKHAIRNEIGVMGTQVSSFDETEELIYTSYFNLMYLKLNSMYRNNLIPSSNRLFCNVGLSAGYLVIESNYCDVQAKDGASYHALIQEAYEVLDLQKFEFSLLAGTGCQFNRFSIELRFELGTGMFNSKNFVTDNSRRLHMLASYSF